MSGRHGRRAAAPQPHAIDLRGSLDSVERDGRIYGWCWSPDEPARRRAVTLRIDGGDAVTVFADILRADLLAAGIGDGGHGFVADIPASLRPPDQSAIISLQDAASGQPIGGDTRITWQAESQPVLPLAGNLDLVTRDGWVSGWCWDPAEPGRRLLLDILLDGEEAGSVEAAEARADLHQAAVGDGRYGFSFMLPYDLLADRGTVQIRVVEHASRRPLGEPSIMRVGRRADAESRMQELERRVTLLQGQLTRLTAASGQQPEVEARAARRMFATMAGFFQDLADGVAGSGLTGGLSGGVAATLAELRRALPPLTLRIPASDASGRPLASIAIPAIGPVAQVHACLVAMHRAGVDGLADIIVLLDPGAGDPGCALLPALVSNLRVGPSDTGVVGGFARLLHDADTRLVGLIAPPLHPGPLWLERLAGTLDSEPRAGIVGCIVTRPDGLLQHAGFWLDDGLRLRDFGHLADPDRFEYRFMRPVEAVGACALLADRTQVAQAGGLDAAYADLGPAIADLCLRLRARGNAVLLQPSVGVRWTATDTDADDRDAQATGDDAHRLRLAILQHARAPRPLFVGHALVVDSHLPRPDRDGGSVVAFEQMLVLRQLGWRVTFAPASSAAGVQADRERLERAGIEVVAAGGDVSEYLRANGPNLQLVHLYRYKVAALLLPHVRALAPNARIVFSPADLHFLREARESALAGSGDPGTATREQELHCIHEADATILLSDHERDLLAGEVDARKLHLLRWIARPQRPPEPLDPTSRQGLVFIGHFGHAPNVDAIVWFARDVSPLLQRLRPGLTLEVIGADAPPSVTALQSELIRVRGWIEDIRPILANARLTIAPLRFGAGFKGKVATSLSAGVPVVGTSIAFEGTGLVEGDGIAVADTPEAFAAAIIGLHDDDARWLRLSERAGDRVASLYSPQAAAAFFRSLLVDLGLPSANTD